MGAAPAWMGTGINTGNNIRKCSARMGRRKTSRLSPGCHGVAGPLCQEPPVPALSPLVGLLGPPGSAQAGARQRVGVHWSGGRKPDRGGGRKGRKGAPGADAEGRYPLRKKRGPHRGGSLPQSLPAGRGREGPRGGSTQMEGGGGGDLGFAPNPQNPPVLRSSPGQSGKAAVIDSCQSPRAWQHRPQGSHPKRARCFSPFQGKREGRMGIEAGDAACTSQHSPGAARRSGVPARLWERLVGVSPHLSTVPKPA